VVLTSACWAPKVSVVVSTVAGRSAVATYFVEACKLTLHRLPSAAQAVPAAARSPSHLLLVLVAAVVPPMLSMVVLARHRFLDRQLALASVLDHRWVPQRAAR